MFQSCWNWKMNVFLPDSGTDPRYSLISAHFLHWEFILKTLSVLMFFTASDLKKQKYSELEPV